MCAWCCRISVVKFGVKEIVLNKEVTMLDPLEHSMSASCGNASRSYSV
jgi:hypothetical protein